MNKKILFVTWCTDDYVEYVGIQKLINSIKYFHPNVDCVIFDSDMTSKITEKYSWIKSENIWISPATCIPFVDDYDMIIYIDGDSTVTGSFNEIFNSTADIISTRCYNSSNLAQSWEPTYLPHYPPYGDGNIIPVQNYVCGGLIASNNKDFWYEWNNLNSYYSDKRDKCLDQQWVLNLIFNSNKYSSEIIDPIGSNLSYGINNGWGPEYDPWQSWREMYVKDDRLFLNDPVSDEILEIKVLHQAGGALSNKLNKYYGGMRNWMRDIFSNEVNIFLDKITK